MAVCTPCRTCYDKAVMAAALPISIVIGYLLGGIPFGILVAGLRGVDIMAVGTGNPGAANVFRRVGRPYGILVALADIAKGALAVLVARWLGLSAGISLAAGAAAVVGHWHSPFLRFKGGTGLAAAIGAAFGVVPELAAIGVAVSVAAIAWRKNVGVGAGLGYAAGFLVGLLLHRPVAVLLGATATGVGVLGRSLLLDLMARRRRQSPPGSS